MRTIELNHEELRALVRFTDPFIHSPEKEQAILSYVHAGHLRPPAWLSMAGTISSSTAITGYWWQSATS
jgi:hypothetical protein